MDGARSMTCGYSGGKGMMMYAVDQCIRVERRTWNVPKFFILFVYAQQSEKKKTDAVLLNVS